MPVTNTTSRILSLAAVALAGCATGHDGDVNIGSGQSPDPVVLDIPVAYVRGPLPDDLTDARRHRRARARDLHRRRRRVAARPRRAGRAGAQHHGARHRRPLGRARHRRLVRRHEDRLLDAHAADPGRHGQRAADLEHLGVRPHDRRAAPRDRLRHRRRGRPRRRAALPAGRPHRLLLDAPAPVEGGADRRGQAAVRRPGRGPERARLRAARDERGRLRHPPDLVQPEPRPRSRRARRRAHRVQPLGERERQLDTFVYGEPGRQRPRSCSTARTATRPAPAAPPTAPSVPGTAEVQFLQPRPTEDGRVVALLKPFQGTEQGGDPVTIDTAAFVEIEPGRPRQPGAPGSRAGAAVASTTCAPIPASRRAGATRPCSRCATAPAACCRPGPCAA